MELMSCQGLIAPHEQTITFGSQLAVAHLQGAASGREREYGCHRMGTSLRVREFLSKQEHSTAFGIDRMLFYEGSE